MPAKLSLAKPPAPLSVEVAQLLAQGLSWEGAVRLVERQHAAALEQLQDVERRLEQAKASRPGAGASDRQIDEHFALVQRMQLRRDAVKADAEKAAALVDHVKSRPSELAFRARGAAATQVADNRFVALQEAEAYLRKAAEVLAGIHLHDPLARGLVQRFGDLIGMSWSDGCISPAVRQRATELVAEIFAGARRPEPPRAA